VIAVVLVNSPGWSRVSDTFFDLEVAVASFPRVIEGLWLNIQVLFVAAVGVAVLGTLLAIARTLKGPVFTPIRLIAAGYTDIFRGIPVLLVLYLVGFGIPGLELTGRMPAQFWGTIALILSYSAYVAEVLRAGIDAVHPSQRLAARSLGLSHGKTLRLVVMPQAVRKVTPALMNDFVSMQKDVGLISVLGAVDAVRAAQIEVASSYNFTPYVLAGVLFVLLSWPFIRLTDWMTARAQKREQVGGTV
jgi:polar amino acid transport system permease protein